MRFAKSSSEQEEICPTCGKRIAEDSHSGSLTSYLFQSFNCSCGSLDERLTPLADTYGKISRGLLKRDSLGSFCPACGLQNYDHSALGSITGFLFQDIRCKCRAEDILAGDGMAERFWKLKEAEADKVFASVTRDVQAKDVHVPTAINLLPGAIIGGVYRIVTLLGQGGMGEVYLANHTSLAKQCALKVIPPDKVTDLSWKRFQNEAKAIANLEHVNLVKVTDLGLHQGCLPFYAMEYVDGISLMDKLKASGRLPLETVLDIFMQVCDGVHHAHRKGVVHRDLKPANIMLIKTAGGKYQVKILDFGLVKLTQKDRNQQSLTRVGEVFGTPYYMSPEQCMGGKIDSRSDVYSVGCSMFEALTGRVPFVEKTAIETITAHQSIDPPTLESTVGPNHFPISLEVVIVKLLRKNPVERYQTLLELRGDLEKVAKGEDVEPYYVSRNKRSQAEPAPRKRPESDPINRDGESDTKLRGILAVATALFAIAAVGFAGFQFLASKKPAPEKAEVESQSGLAEIMIKSEPKYTNFDAGAGTGTGSNSSSNSGSSSGTDTNADTVAGSTFDLKPGANAGTAADTTPTAAKVTTPYSTIVEENGQRIRVFHFPLNAMFGRVMNGKSVGGEAAGTMKCPADEYITFIPEVDAVKYPGYLKRFQSGDISACAFSKFSAEWADEGSIASIRACSLIPGVKDLDLRNSDDLSASGVAVLDKYQSLRSVILGKVDVDTVAFSKLSRLQKLRDLQMSGYYDVAPIISNLKSSSAMTRLSMPCSAVDIQGFESLSTLPNLEVLILGQIQPGDPATTIKAISVLSKNKKLKEISIRNLTVTPATVASLKSLPGLKVLRFSQAGNDAATALNHRLFREFPQLKLGPPYLDSGKLPRS